MPGGNRRGPEGFGPRTGRGLGYCSGYNVPGYINRGFGFGRGAGWGYGSGMVLSRGRHFNRGMGFGFGYRQFGADIQAADISEKEYLKDEIAYLKEQLVAMEKRFSELNQEEK